MRSTAEWEAVLEGAHLDGVTLNWLDNGRDPVTGQDLGARIVYYDGGYTGGEIDLPSGGLICESVPGDVAALFTLSPEAVAEMIAARRENERLRRELERLREDMERRERLAGAFGLTTLVEAIVSSKITRILEGTNE